MAYIEQGLRRMTYGGAVGNGVGSVRSMWHYVTADAAATVEAANYFNSASSQFTKGDKIELVAAVGGTPVSKTLVVTSATGAATVVVAQSSVTAG
jgi:hypothetical protein